LVVLVVAVPLLLATPVFVWVVMAQPGKVLQAVAEIPTILLFAVVVVVVVLALSVVTLFQQAQELVALVVLELHLALRALL
jgi:hypothetical protein